MERDGARKPKPVGHVRLCLELLDRRDGPDHVWALVASIPGRESVVTYQWRVGGAQMSESQLRDISTRVSALLVQCIVMLDGVQGELRLVK